MLYSLVCGNISEVAIPYGWKITNFFEWLKWHEYNDGVQISQKNTRVI